MSICIISDHIIMLNSKVLLMVTQDGKSFM